jgi:WD40 repeat protein
MCQDFCHTTTRTFVCNEVDIFSGCQDGSSIIAGCSDGTIRAHAPQTGSRQYIIHNAHHTAVLALAVAPDGKTIVSGDTEGFLRVWRIGASSQTMIMSLKEHKVCIQESFQEGR